MNTNLNPAPAANVTKLNEIFEYSSLSKSKSLSLSKSGSKSCLDADKRQILSCFDFDSDFDSDPEEWLILVPLPPLAAADALARRAGRAICRLAGAAAALWAGVVGTSALAAAELAEPVTWPPEQLSATDHVYVLPIEVISATAQPPALTFRFWRTDYALNVYRKLENGSDWGQPLARIPAGTSEWTDTSIESGIAYGYRFHASGVPLQTTDAGWVNTYLVAGVEVDRTLWRGRVVLVMPASIQEPLADEIARFKQDLNGDGWSVSEVLTPNGRDDWLDAAWGHHVAIRDAIRDIYFAHPGEVKHVILLGRVPQPRSGLRSAWAPDGHGDLGAVAADCYYADVDSDWTDTGSITVEYGNNAGQVRPPWHNNPGDGRFDQSHFRHLPQAFEMGWGRIDFRRAINGDRINGGDEIGALRDYLNKLHHYKHASNGFRPGRRALIRDDGSFFKHLQEEFWKTITPLSGMANLEYIGRQDLPFSRDLPEAVYSFNHGPYLYLFMAGMEPIRNSDMSRAVFWTGFKSHVGYWDLNGWMRQSIAYPNAWTLSWTFNPPRGRYLYHKMALGGTMGDVMRATINNQSSTTGHYGSAVRNFLNGANFVQQPFGATHDYSGFTFMGHMGDPTLREHMIASPAWLMALTGTAPSYPPSYPPSSLPSSTHEGADDSTITLVWPAADEPGINGYHLYAADNPTGPFQRITDFPVHTSASQPLLSHRIPSPQPDHSHFMVRTVRLESTPSGSYWNASIGRIAAPQPWPQPPPPPVATVSIAGYQLQLRIDPPPSPLFRPSVLASHDLHYWDPNPVWIHDPASPFSTTSDSAPILFTDPADLRATPARWLRVIWMPADF